MFYSLSSLNKKGLAVIMMLLFRFSSLYEQDEANVFAEPSVMSAHVLPHLLQLAEKSSKCSTLAHSLTSWAEENTTQVLEDLKFCEKIVPGTTFGVLFLLFPCFSCIKPPFLLVFFFFRKCTVPCLVGSPCGSSFLHHPVRPLHQSCLSPPSAGNLCSGTTSL